jgi:hypothetical protein
MKRTVMVLAVILLLAIPIYAYFSEDMNRDNANVATQKALPSDLKKTKTPVAPPAAVTPVTAAKETVPAAAEKKKEGEYANTINITINIDKGKVSVDQPGGEGIKTGVTGTGESETGAPEEAAGQLDVQQ